MVIISESASHRKMHKDYRLPYNQQRHPQHKLWAKAFRESTNMSSGDQWSTSIALRSAIWFLYSFSWRDRRPRLCRTTRVQTCSNLFVRTSSGPAFFDSVVTRWTRPILICSRSNRYQPWRRNWSKLANIYSKVNQELFSQNWTSTRLPHSSGYI